MDTETKTLRLADLEGVDRLNDLDKFLRESENDPVNLDVSGKDYVPTQVLQSIISAAQHWAQRDVKFTISGCTEKAIESFSIVGANLDQFISEGASE